MGKKGPKADSWLDKKGIAAAFDVSPRYFDRTIRPLVDRQDVRRQNGRLWFYARGVIEAWARGHITASKGPQREGLELEDLLLLHELNGEGH